MKCSLLVLSSYLDGELDARRDGELEAHLVGCQRCRAGLGYLREEVERVSTLGRVHVADHSVHALLAQVGLIDEDEPQPAGHGAAVALAEPPGYAPPWMGADEATAMPWAIADVAASSLERSVDMTGTPARGALPTMEREVELELEPEAEVEPTVEGTSAAEAAQAADPADAAEPATTAETGALELPSVSDTPERPWFRWVPPAALAPPTEAPTPAAAAHAPPPEPEHEPEPEPEPLQANRPPFTWSPPPTAIGAGEPAAAVEGGVPAAPFTVDSGRPGDIPAPAHAPPPADLVPDHAPTAPPSGGAFPPGGPERIEPSDSPTHATVPGGEPEMTASPPWAPHDAPAGPLYPMTDDDVLGEPVPVERFGPPPQAPRPSLFERVRDRIAVRRALARSSSAYEDQVQIVSGLGAPLRPGRARLEVERRRQEALRMDPGAIPGEEPARHRPDEADDGVDAELGLGPLPPLPPEQSPMPRPAPRPTLPGQMALPGTSVGDPRRPSLDESLPPVHRVPMPPPGHTIGSVLGELPPPRPPMRPAVPPPLPPIPDPLSEALSGFDREPGSTSHEPRPWRPRDVAEDRLAVPAPPRPVVPGRPDTAERRSALAQQREGRRLLALFGAAALLMFVVGIVSGRTTSPLPSSSTTGSSGALAPASAKPQAKASNPAARASTTPAPIVIGPQASAQPSQAPATSAPQLTSVKVLGDSGTGYQVKGFRYGIHPNDFRIVLDITASGAASGTPKATIGFLDPTTLLVVLDGVVPAGSTGELPSSDPVTAVTLMQQSPFPGSTVYQLKLAHPVQFTAGYMTSPLRLVLDLAS